MPEKDGFANKEAYAYEDLLYIMERLRAPDGCPWDREQDHESLKKYMIEEAYEALEAIDRKSPAMLCEELGDILLQIVFHANIAGDFTMAEVVDGVCKKMIRRHPHVFGDVQADTSAQVLENWEKIKAVEKGVERQAERLESVPANLPALMRAYKVNQKASDAGFDWEKKTRVADLFEKVGEEMEELRDAVAAGAQPQIDEELGDVLFVLAHLANCVGSHPEMALSAATDKFIRRFALAEGYAAADGKTTFQGMPAEEMDAYWRRAKEALRANPG